MAQGGLPTPNRLVLDIDSAVQAKQWEEWLQEVTMYFVAADITDKARKRAVLLYLAGKEVRDIYEAFTDTDKTFESTSTILTNYFSEKKNISFERFQFHSVSKQENENFKSYIIRLKKLAVSCDFENYSTEHAIVDKFIGSCGSSTLRRKLLSEEKLDLEQVVKIATTMQLVNSQVSEISKGEQSSYEEVCAIRGKTVGAGKQCFGCGGFGHAIHDSDCPASGKFCFRCKGEGHFQGYCIKSKTKKYDHKLHNLEIEGSDSDDYLF